MKNGKNIDKYGYFVVKINGSNVNQTSSEMGGNDGTIKMGVLCWEVIVAVVVAWVFKSADKKRIFITKVM